MKSLETNQEVKFGKTLDEFLSQCFLRWGEARVKACLLFYMEGKMRQYMERFSTQEKAFKSSMSGLNLFFPFGNVGCQYSYEFTLPAEYADASLAGYEQIGLQSDRNGLTIRLYGEPVAVGKYTVSIVMPTATGDSMQVNYPLEIGVHPHDMWKNIPTPSSIKYYKPDSDASSLTPEGGAKRMVAASIRGRSHAHEGTPRDDDYGMRYLDNGWYVAVVADGAGSAKYSREGSRVACEAILSSCQEHLQDGQLDHLLCSATPDFGKDLPKGLVAYVQKLMTSCALEAYQAVESVATSAGESSKKYSTTLLFTIFRQIAPFGWFVASYGIGDGIAALYCEGADAGPQVTLLTSPDSGEYAGETHFLQEKMLLTERRVRMAVLPDFTSILLMTDGVSDAKFEVEKQMEDALLWRNIWSDLHDHVLSHATEKERENALLEWLAFWSAGNYDDRTLLLAY